MDLLQKIFFDSGLMALTWQNVTMFVVSGVLMYLAIAKQYEPMLLLPIGFGCILGNLPVSAYMIGPEGLFGTVFEEERL